jgi:hypothetical protein
MVFSPIERPMPETDQLVVPVAVPFPPTVTLCHVTTLMPLELSDALPLMLNEPVGLVYTPVEVGLVMVTVGEVVSRVIELFAALDTFPALSLYQTYTVLLPSPLLTVYDTFAVKLVVEVTEAQPVAEAEGVDELSER